VQPWLGYNANMIRVGPFQTGDPAGLAQTANHGSSIYRQINLTANRVENNWMMTGDTAPWEAIDSAEADDFFGHASVNNDVWISSLSATLRAAPVAAKPLISIRIKAGFSATAFSKPSLPFFADSRRLDK
jgi:hypothetical protein